MGRRQGPPAFPATPRGVSPPKGYPGTPEADRAPLPLPEETHTPPLPTLSKQVK